MGSRGMSMYTPTPRAHKIGRGHRKLKLRKKKARFSLFGDRLKRIDREKARIAKAKAKRIAREEKAKAKAENRKRKEIARAVAKVRKREGLFG